MGRGTSQTKSLHLKGSRNTFPSHKFRYFFAPANAVKLKGKIWIFLFIPLTSLKHFGGDRSVHSNFQQSNSLIPKFPSVTDPLG